MIVKKDKDTILDYLEDSSGLRGGFVDEVVFPESESELIEFLKEANLKNIPLTVSGGRTGVTGGAVPFGGVLVSTENLNKTLEVNKEEQEIKVGCSIRPSEIEMAISKEGFMYPANPTEKDSFIGGNIATNSSGARSFMFGSTRDYVKSLRIVLPDGDVLVIKREQYISDSNNKFNLITESKRNLNFQIPEYKIPTIKNAAGYFVKKNMDAIDLFIGQEGTLGIIVEAELKLVKAPFDIIGILAFFEKEEGALSFSDRLRELSLRSRANNDRPDKPNAVSIEYFDPMSINMLREEYKNIPSNASCAIFFEQIIESDTEETILNSYEAMLKGFNLDLEKCWCSVDEKTKRQLHDFRHKLPVLVNEKVKRNGFAKVGTDIAVPIEHFRSMYSFYKGNINSLDIDYVIFGHIGDCHLHVNLLPRDEKEFKISKELYIKFIDKAISFGGTISAEHGIGKLKHVYLERMYGKDAIAQMAKLKKVFDPNCILNLDNMFPKEYMLSLT